MEVVVGDHGIDPNQLKDFFDSSSSDDETPSQLQLCVLDRSKMNFLKAQLRRSFKKCRRSIMKETNFDFHKDLLLNQVNDMEASIWKYFQKFNIVFIGRTKAGKSSCIATILPSEKGKFPKASPFVNDTTKALAPYNCTDFANLDLQNFKFFTDFVCWDTPGIGCATSVEQLEMEISSTMADCVCIVFDFELLDQDFSELDMKKFDDAIKKLAKLHFTPKKFIVVSKLKRDGVVCDHDIYYAKIRKFQEKMGNKGVNLDDYDIVPWDVDVQDYQVNFINRLKEIKSIHHEARIESLESTITLLKIKIIFGFAGIAAGFGFLPFGPDVAMAMILTRNMEIILRGVSGGTVPTDYSVGNMVVGVAMGSLTVLRVSFIIGQLISKLFTASLIGFLIGQGISVGCNFLFVSGWGFIVWAQTSSDNQQELSNVI